MALYDTTWYCNAGDQSTTGYYAVAKRPQNTAVIAGQLVRQFTAPAVNSERVFVCIVAGTTANTTDATWALTRGVKVTDGTATWQECTGASAVNGDLTNTPTWTQAKALGNPSLGAIIQRNSGASYWICSTAGTLGASEPAWVNNTAGTTQADNTVTWTCLGVVGNFTGGQAPFPRLASVCANTWFAAGNTVYVGDNHAESSTANITISPAVAQASTGKIICHNHSGPYPPTSADLATTATVTGTAAFGSISLNVANVYVYGLSFIAGSGGTPTNILCSVSAGTGQCESCIFKLASTATSYVAPNATSAGTMIWNNCQVSFGSTSTQFVDIGNTSFIWRNTGQVLAAGSVVPNYLIGNSASGRVGVVVLEALDLSQLTTVFNANAGGGITSTGSWIVKDCKLNPASVFPPLTNGGQILQLIRADGGATAYKSARYAYEGTETTETSITRVGGASDPTGQAQSRKIVTTANSQWLRPFNAEPYAIWNAITGSSVTVTVCGTINDASLPRNDDIWIEVEHLGSSSFPVGTIVNTTKSNLLAANAAVASDGSTWNGGGSGAGWSPFKLTTTITPQMAGHIHVSVRAAKVSATWYIDPKVVLT